LLTETINITNTERLEQLNKITKYHRFQSIIQRNVAEQLSLYKRNAILKPHSQD